ncbi:MAG TPA: threonine/serine dehydratase [Chloroflexota bacterium]
MVSLDDVQAAAERIRPYVVRTPLERSATLSDLGYGEVWLKLECFQRTGSFKLRGALNALQTLPSDRRQRGVVTASAGNHGLGVAQAAALLGVDATVVLPETASQAKIAMLRTFAGTELLLRGANYDAAESAARQLATETGKAFISAYNDAAVIAGGGTIALEILDELPDATTLVLPAGGGGLISGVALAAHGIDPTMTIYGVQSEASPALHAAHRSGHLTQVDIQDSLADGLSGNVEQGSMTFELIQQHVKDIALVSEVDIARAMRFLLEHEHVLAEGSAAVGVAAIQNQDLELAPDGPTVIVLTGRNVAAAVLRQYVFDS